MAMAAHDNRVRALISRNRVEDVGGIPIFIQAGVAEAQEEATDNEVLAQVHRQQAADRPGQTVGGHQRWPTGQYGTP